MTVEATSISDFCASHGISRATFYNLKARGAAPKTMIVGRRRLVSSESAAAWRRAMEACASDKEAGEA